MPREKQGLSADARKQTQMIALVRIKRRQRMIRRGLAHGLLVALCSLSPERFLLGGEGRGEGDNLHVPGTSGAWIHPPPHPYPLPQTMKPFGGEGFFRRHLQCAVAFLDRFP